PAPNNQGRAAATPVLSDSAYHDLLDTAITVALEAQVTPGVNNQRGGAARVVRALPQPNPQTPPDDATLRQNNARTLLLSMQTILPQIDQYMPERAQAVRQKLTEMGVNSNAMNFGAQMRTMMQQGTSDSLVTAANSAPPQMQSRLYQ